MNNHSKIKGTSVIPCAVVSAAPVSPHSAGAATHSPERAHEKVGGLPVAAAPTMRRKPDALLPTRQGAGMERGIDQGVAAGETAPDDGWGNQPRCITCRKGMSNCLCDAPDIDVPSVTDMKRIMPGLFADDEDAALVYVERISPTRIAL